MTDPVEIELKPLTDMITTIFSNDFVEFVVKKHGTLRDFYETSSPTTQCNNTVGAVEPDKTKCWICGFTIPATADQQHAFSPECEHVFPIAQAIFFIGLYTSDVKSNAEYVNKLKLEYDWAHRVCNQIKNDSHFIHHNIQNPDGRWSIDPIKIKDFLKDILARGNKYKGGATLLKQQIQKQGISVDKWISDRTAAIQKRCDSIIKTIQPKNENLWVLATVSDLAHAYQNSGFVPEAIEPYNPVARSGQNVLLNQEQVTRVYTTWAEFIIQHVRQFSIGYLGERLRRFTPEEKAMRSEKVLVLLDSSLITKVGQYVGNIYSAIPDNVNKQARFVEGVQYLISSVLLERMTRIFTDISDKNSPSLKTLSAELLRNVELIRDVWNTNGLQNGINALNNILSTELKGAARRKRR